MKLGNLAGELPQFVGRARRVRESGQNRHHLNARRHGLHPFLDAVAGVCLAPPFNRAKISQREPYL